MDCYDEEEANWLGKTEIIEIDVQPLRGRTSISHIPVLSNREEGLGPEAEYYLAYWVEAHELLETEVPTTLVFQRGTDGNVYLDGRLVSITLLK